MGKPDQSNVAIEKLRSLLKTLFQFDCADLDFGVYRIMNYKRKEIEQFIEKDIIQAVAEEFKKYEARNKGELLQKIEAKRKEIIRDEERLGEKILKNGDLEDKFQDKPFAREYLELKRQLADVEATEDEKTQVFNDLYTFFSRYYEDGDFIAKKRLSSKGDRYAIPYSGEEVKLHWANYDQYYVKTGEMFKDYEFVVKGWRVMFKTVAADVEAGNGVSERRYFVLAQKEPVKVEKGMCLIQWQYVPATEDALKQFKVKTKSGEEKRTGIQQDEINGFIKEQILQCITVAELKTALIEQRDDKTVLERHLYKYTKRITSDFFIHKNLRSFLERELDYFIKSEILDISSLEPRHVSKVKVIEGIGKKIVAFLSQLEDFQKLLFERRKFITDTQYCIAVGNVVEGFYAEIATNNTQWAEWKGLFHIDENGRDLFNAGARGKKDKRVAFLRAHPTLMLDTKHFDQDFRDRLLASFDHLDDMIDGLLIHGENFQALTLLSERYRERVNCVYVDPPYNSDASPILYKNDYKSSTWASLMDNRLRIARPLLTTNGVLVAAIDDEQQRELSFILSSIFDNRLLGTICVRANPSGRPTKTGYSVAHDYLLFAGQGPDSAIGRMPPTEDQIARFSEHDEKGLFEWRNLRREGSNSDRTARPALYYPIYVKGTSMRVPKMTWNATAQEWVVEEKARSGEQVVLPDNEAGAQKTWRWEWTTVLASIVDLAVRKDRSGRDYIYCKRRPHEEGVVSVSCWFDAKYSATEHGTAVLKALFGKSVFSYPKSIDAVVDSIYVAGASRTNAYVLDCFAGSGTTAHAVINLNREDGGRRRFILVEVDEYFDTVLLPRIKKVVFSPEWKEGKPVREATAEEANRSPRIVKIIRLENYEDTLHNVEFMNRDKGQTALQLFGNSEEGNEYMVKYFLRYETEGSASLVNLKQFESPFDYTLKVISGSKGEQTVVVDMVETFNYLLGLSVQQYKTMQDNGRKYVVVLGEARGKKAAVVWRPTKDIDLEKDKQIIESALNGFDADEMFINGDSLIKSYKPIESEFKALMFAPSAR